MLNAFTILAAFIAGLIKTTFGVGAGVFLTPLLSIILEPKTAVALMAPMMLITDLSTLGIHWNKWDKKQLYIIFPGTIVGTFLGSYFLAWASPQATKITIGVIAMAFSALQIYRLRNQTLLAQIRFNNWHGCVISLLAGFASAVAHSGGIVLTIYLISLNLSKQSFVATLVGFLLFADILKMVMFTKLGLLNSGLVKASLLLTPILLLGSWVGSKLIEKLSDSQFVLFVNILIFISGLVLLIKH